jgi:broad specificity phosphatase PhoE
MFLWMVVALIVTVALIAAPAPRNVATKLLFYLRGMKYLVLSKDLPKKFSGSNFIRIDGAGTAEAGNSDKKRVIKVVFVRHGQSVWNSLFNQFGLGWPIRMAKACLLEAWYWLAEPFQSVIIDSPLSAKGLAEAQDLASFVRGARSRLPFDPSTSVIVASNLRRAMETAIIGFGPRVSVTREKISICSSLQEGSRNIDAMSFSQEKGRLANTKVYNYDTALMLQTIFDASLNDGNKPLSSNVFLRQTEFVKQLFGMHASASASHSLSSPTFANKNLTEVVVVGHSGWFKCFFQRFLPASSTHVSKTKKMKNCSVVSFNLVRNESTSEVYIEEGSIEILYKGF